MSNRTRSDVCPFVVHHAFGSGKLTQDQRILLSPDDEDFQVDPTSENINPKPVNGWSWTSDVDKVGKKQRLYASGWRKGDLMVGILNESEYASIGRMSATVVSDSSEAIYEFLLDQKLDGQVEENSAVQQTL